MNYQTFYPAAPVASFVKCYWSLQASATMHPGKQRIVPDGCMEMIFILGDDIKRYTAEEDFIIQPRAIVVGQLSKAFVIEPTGSVHCFAARFYPHGFANFITTPLQALEDTETPIAELFGEVPAAALAQKIIAATTDAERIAALETFFMDKLQEQATIDQLVTTTIDMLVAGNGSTPIKDMLEAQSKRRQLERKFFKQVGLSPKQLGKVIRLQAALKLLLNRKHANLVEIAYQSDYYDQAHFIRDFKDFTGINPGEFLTNDEMLLSAVFYTND